MDFVTIEADAGSVKRLAPGELADRQRREDTHDVWVRFDDVVSIIAGVLLSNEVPPAFQGSES